MIIQRTVLDPITGVCILVGEGSPNGLDAPSGSLYIRRDSAQNEVLYTKYNTGSSDWSVLTSGSGGGSSVSASYALTASFATNAATASILLGSVTSASYALSSSFATTSSFARSASFATNARNAVTSSVICKFCKSSNQCQ